MVAELQCEPPLRVLAGRRGVAGPSVGEVMGRVLRIQGMSVRGVRLGPGGLVVQVRPRQRKPRCGELKKTNQTLYRAYLLKESLARGMESSPRPCQ